MSRINSGVKGFDELIEGGFPKKSITLVTGTPGTGKSIFLSELVFANAVKGKKCLFIDLEQKENQVIEQLEEFGFSLKKTKNNLRIINIDGANSNTLEIIFNEINKKYDIIVIDSIESIVFSSSILEKNKKMGLEQIQETVIPTILDTKSIGRLKLRKLFSELTKTNATIFVVGEKVEGSIGLSRDSISEFLCDNIIVMNYVGVGAIDFRSMQIRKMRRSKHEKDFVLFDINEKGIELIEDPLKKRK